METYKSGETPMVGDVVRCGGDVRKWVVKVVDDGDSSVKLISESGVVWEDVRSCTLVRRATPTEHAPTDADRYAVTIDGQTIRLEAIIAACLAQERTGFTHADAGYVSHIWKYLFRMGLKSPAIQDARKLHDWTGKLVSLMEREGTVGGWVDTTEYE